MLLVLAACAPEKIEFELMTQEGIDIKVDVDGQEYKPKMLISEGEHTLRYSFPLCPTQEKKITVTRKSSRYELVPHCVMQHHSMSWSWIPAGGFRFGSLIEGEKPDDDESSQYWSFPRSFWMSQTEVTQSLYEEVMGENPVKKTACSRVRIPMEVNNRAPVYCVDWFEALEFANALSKKDKLEPCYRILNEAVLWKKSCTGYRLPTEFEWEYVASAGTSLVYSGSNSIGEVAWTDTNAGGEIHEVALLKPNNWGLYDMSGNLWEWTWDRYEHTATPKPNRELRGGLRVIRGGSWYKGPDKSRVRDRANFHPGYRTDVVGFRLVREALKDTAEDLEQ